MSLSNAASTYWVEVIQAGDDVSTLLKKACIWANNQFSYLHHLRTLHGSNVILNHPLIHSAVPKLESQTDGVGTKVRIYMRQFNLMYEAFRAERMRIEEHMMNTSALEDWDGMSEPPGAYVKRLQQEFQETANELMYRMMLDLYAMIVDDFRKGHMAISVTDIIDINHIKIAESDPDKEQWIVWANAMKYALESVIKETQIALVAGETAILKAGDNEKAQERIAATLLERVEAIMRNLKRNLPPMSISRDFRDELLAILSPEGEKTPEELRRHHTIVEGRMELNIGGSGNGILNGEKLVDMRPGDVVLAFFEKKTDKGIISPRANGISAIRRLENFLGDTWTDKTLGDFFDHPEIAQKPGAYVLKQEFLNQWLSLNLKIWDIATGRTTVFNPFINRELLGWFWASRYDISGLAHMTGNPPRKWAELIGERNLSMTIDYSNVEFPQIIKMLLLAEDLTFEQGLSMFNMGIPQMVACRPNHVKWIQEEATEAWFSTQKVGEICAVEEGNEPTVTIRHGGGEKRYSVKELLIET